MKKLSFLAFAAAGLLLGACADKDVVEESNQLNRYDMIEGQSSWISVGIALPGDPITRANEDLNDGVEAEFTVYSAKLVLFKGANEDEATLIKDYDITTEFNNETGDNTPGGGTAPNNAGEVSQTSTKVVKEIESPKLAGEDNLYGYVILNWDGNSTGISFAPNTAFSDFKEQVLKAIGIADESAGFGPINNENHGLVMTNVPIADHPGGEDAPAADTKVTTLSLISKDAVYTTKAAAEAGSATACIYVERAAVKVQVENKATGIELPGETTPINFTFNGWALGNVNYGGTNGTGYYNTRQFDEEWLPYNNEQAKAAYLQWRMVGRTNFFTSGHTTAYRTYFGRDVNYTNAPSATNTFAATNLKNKQLTDAQYTLESGDATYTYENTFDENSQIWANTTYIGVKLTVDGGDFYTIEGQPNTMLKTADLAGEVAKNHSGVISTANTTIEGIIEDDLESASSSLNEGKDEGSKITKVSYKIIVNNVTQGDRAADGSVSYTYTLALSDIKNKIGDATEYTAMAAADITKLNALTGVSAALNPSTPRTGTTKIYKYVGGATYYSMRIAHFGDVETPWSAPAEAYNNYPLIYPLDGVSSHEAAADKVTYSTSRASAWLGRWGIVRNNWYQLSIDKIEGLGSPVPEDYSGEAGGTPDDNPEPKYYITAHVHILPWAVRKQSVNF